MLLLLHQVRLPAAELLLLTRCQARLLLSLLESAALAAALPVSEPLVFCFCLMLSACCR
jgi:hypothetical protein